MPSFPSRLHRCRWLALVVACAASWPVSAGAQSLRQITGHARVHEVQPVVSADGTTVAWLEYAPNSPGYSIGISDARGHKRRQFTPGAPPTAVGFLRISGDGSTLVYALGGQLWVQPTAGGPPRAITPVGKSCWNPSITDDGRLVAYAVRDALNQMAVEVVDTTTLAVSPIANVTVWTVSEPAIAGDGSSVLLTNRTATGIELWHYTLAGTPIRRLAADVGGFDAAFDYGGTITAYDATDGTGWHLKTVTTQGVVTTIGAPGVEARPVFVSANGDRVIWSDPDVRVAYADGTGARRAVSLSAPSNPPSVPLAVSRDGGIVVFSTALPLLKTSAYGDAELFVWRDALTGAERTSIGSPARFLIDVPNAPWGTYVARCSFARTGGPVIPGVGRVPLAPDVLFRASGALPTIFRNMSGRLDGKGRATFEVAIPNLAPLRGVRFYSAALVAGPSLSLTPAIARTIR